MEIEDYKDHEIDYDEHKGEFYSETDESLRDETLKGLKRKIYAKSKKGFKPFKVFYWYGWSNSRWEDAVVTSVVENRSSAWIKSDGSRSKEACIRLFLDTPENRGIQKKMDEIRNLIKKHEDNIAELQNSMETVSDKFPKKEVEE